MQKLDLVDCREVRPEPPSTPCGFVECFEGAASVIDARGNILAVNEDWAVFAGSNGGVDAGAYVGRNYIDICDRASGSCSEGAQDVAAGIRSVLDGSSRSYTKTYPCHSPIVRRWFKCLVKPIPQDGRIAGAVIQHVDATDEIEGRLLASAKLEVFATAAAGMGGYAWDWNLRTGSIDLSEGAHNLLGSDSRAPLDVQALRNRIHPDDRDRVAESLRAALRGKVMACNSECRLWCADGTWHWFHVCGYAKRDQRGRVERLLGLSLDITERKRSDERAERARQEARRLAMVAEKTDNAVVITDAVGRIEWVNAGFSEITGWSLDQVLGRTPGEFLRGPETSEAHQAAVTKAIANAEALTTEIVNYHADGHPFWWEIDMQPVLGDDGAPAHFIAIERDVSRRKAQDTLAQARSDVFERIAAGAGQADVLEALARALEHGAIGMTASILVRDQAGERLHVAAAPGLPRRYRDALNGLVIGPRVVGCGTAAFNAERCVAEDIFAHPNWRDHETLANLSGMRACWSQPVQSEDGNVQGVLELYAPRSRAPGQWEIELIEQAAALCANVLMHFEVIAAENASHRRLASMAEAVPVPVVYLGRDAVVRYANAAWASYHNTERDKLVGKPLPELVGAKAWAVIEKPFRDALTGKRQCFEARLEYRPDLVLDVRINLVPEFARDGSVTGAYKVPENLTEFRCRERELRSAYEAAEKANKAKSDFLANMSHELRTPLNAILGYTDIMKQQMFGPLGSERYVDYINDIHASGSYLLDLLQDVLDLARLDAGGRELTYDRVDLHEAIECAARMQGQRKADVRVRHCDPLPVLADERALKQVLINVVDNALKYGGEKGVDIDVAQTAVDTVSVTVSDFGPGIAPDDLAHVTEPFYTGKRSAMVAKQSTEGTGVGLALSKRLSESMGGSLTIESEVGQGTNVTISLPLPPEPTEPAL